MLLEDTLNKIVPPGGDAAARAKERWDSLAKPLGSLGLLEEAVIRIAAMTDDPDYFPEKCALAVMCADNGVVAQGVTQTDSSVTALVAGNLACGKSVVNVMAKQAGADVFPIDVGMAQDVPADGLWRKKVAYGTRDITVGPAMTRQQAVQAIEAGIETARLLAAQGYRLLAAGEMGIGNTTTGSAVTAVLLDQPPERVTGRGAGLSREGLARKISAIRQAILINRPNPSDPIDVVSKVGGFDLAAMAGLYLGGAALKLPVMLDGVISAAAALLAAHLCPACREYMVASHVSGEPAGAMLLDALGLRAFLTAGMRLGEGTGAMAALPVLKMAYTVYFGTSTFSQIQMDPYRPLD